MKRILITGSNGMLGRELCRKLDKKYDLVGLNKSESIFTKHSIKCNIADKEKVINDITLAKPDIVIHTAASTDVDGCELNYGKAYTINAVGTFSIAEACFWCSAPLIYISTDFVFDGKKKKPYIESDKPNPINIYGKTKLAGEEFIQQFLKKFVIIRTSWLFGEGKNFVDTFLKKAKKQKRIEIVKNQIGSPTYTKDLASAIYNLLNFNLYNFYHITNSGSCSWYELALEIKKILNLKIDIMPILASKYDSFTMRPKMSILKNSRTTKLRNWKKALKEYLIERG